MINYLDHFVVQSVQRNNGIFKVHLKPVDQMEGKDIIIINTVSDSFQRGDVWQIHGKLVSRGGKTQV